MLSLYVVRTGIQGLSSRPETLGSQVDSFDYFDGVDKELARAADRKHHFAPGCGVHSLHGVHGLRAYQAYMPTCLPSLNAS